MPAINPTALPIGDKSYLFVSGGNTLTWACSGSAINGFRAYFHLLGYAASVKSFAMNFSEGEATSIHNSQFTISNDEAGVWYDLNGRKLNSKPGVKGIYISNGRKVVIK